MTRPRLTAPSASRRFVHVTFPLLANLYLVCTLLSTLWTLGDFTTVYLVSGGGPAGSTEVLATLGFHYAFDSCQAGTRRRGGDVGPPGADPDCDRADAPAADERGAAMSIAMALRAGGRAGATGCDGFSPKRARSCSALSSLIWSLLPVYNMLLIALDPEEGEIEFSGNHLAARSRRSTASGCRDAGSPVSRGFLAPVRQQPLHRSGDDGADRADRLAGELCGEPDAARQRLAAHQRRASHLCDPGILPDCPATIGSCTSTGSRTTSGRLSRRR